MNQLSQTNRHLHRWPLPPPAHYLSTIAVLRPKNTLKVANRTIFDNSFCFCPAIFPLIHRLCLMFAHPSIRLHCAVAGRYVDSKRSSFLFGLSHQQQQCPRPTKKKCTNKRLSFMYLAYVYWIYLTLALPPSATSFSTVFSMHSFTILRMFMGSCSTQPSLGVVCVNSCWWKQTISAVPALNKTKRADDVPSSIEPTKSPNGLDVIFQLQFQ